MTKIVDHAHLDRCKHTHTHTHTHTHWCTAQCLSEANSIARGRLCSAILITYSVAKFIIRLVEALIKFLAGQLYVFPLRYRCPIFAKTLGKYFHTTCSTFVLEVVHVPSVTSKRGR